MRKLMKYAKQYTWQSIICPILMVGEVVLELMLPYYMSYIIDVGIPNGDRKYIIEIGVKMVAMALGSLFCGATAARLASVASMGFGTNLRTAMYESIQNFSFSNIDKFSTASLVTRMTTDVTQIQNMYMMMLRIFFRAPLMFAIALTMSFKISRTVANTFLVVIPIILIFLALFGPIAVKRFKKVFNMFDGLNASVQENLIAMRVVKAFVREDYEKKKFKKANDDLMDASVSAEKMMVMAQPLMMFLMFGTILTITYISSKLILRGEMEIGKFSTLTTYVMMILMSVIMIAMILVQYVMSRAAAARIAEVIEEKPDINDDDAQPDLKVKDGSVEFKNVCFKYSSDGKKNVIDGASFKINSGETVGVIGGTGSAKTTLVSLIPRLYDVTGGEVLVGGENVKKYKLFELREAVSMVLQKNVLFSGTIIDNLRWGNENASDEEMIEACRLAQADEFVRSFPDGYDTYIEQGGTNVSGGQKQRLCIARALLKKPKILILDDSTSAVDTRTDALIREGFRTYIPETTKIIIAQRVASVQDADLILVMNNGRIADMGTHEQLLISSAIYREVYESQTNGGDSNEA